MQTSGQLSTVWQGPSPLPRLTLMLSGAEPCEKPSVWHLFYNLRYSFLSCIHQCRALCEPVPSISPFPKPYKQDSSRELSQRETNCYLISKQLHNVPVDLFRTNIQDPTPQEMRHWPCPSLLRSVLVWFCPPARGLWYLVGWLFWHPSAGCLSSGVAGLRLSPWVPGTWQIISDQVSAGGNSEHVVSICFLP